MKLLREPLLHFALLAGLLVLVHSLVADLASGDPARRIEIGAAEVELLAGNWQRQWRRPPTEEELRGLVDSRVREEVLYREALAVGLDRNDVIVRRRMVQKMELLTQDLALLGDPTDQELRAFFEERIEDYRLPPRLSFSHIYFNADRRGAATESDAARVLAELRAETPPPQRAPELGDRFMLPLDFSLQSPDEVRRSFGERFAEELFDLEAGWQGPIVSGYGLHLVYVGERVEGRLPEYDEVRGRLVQDFDRVRGETMREELYRRLAEGYEISIDETALRESDLSVPSR